MKLFIITPGCWLSVCWDAGDDVQNRDHENDTADRDHAAGYGERVAHGRALLRLVLN